jgi:hypothetical protein
MFGRKEHPAEKPMIILRGDVFTQLPGRASIGRNQSVFVEAATAPALASTLDDLGDFGGLPASF